MSAYQARMKSEQSATERNEFSMSEVEVCGIVFGVEHHSMLAEALFHYRDCENLHVKEIDVWEQVVAMLNWQLSAKEELERLREKDCFGCLNLEGLPGEEASITL